MTFRACRIALAVAVLTSLLLVFTFHHAPPAMANGPFKTEAPFWITNSAGDVTAFGSAGDYGDLRNVGLNKPIVGMTPTPSTHGYWMVASDGGVFSFGDAAFYGSTGGIKLNKPIVGMTPTPTNKGYYMVASDGGIFAFGDAAFYGSTGGIHLNQPIVGMATTPTNKGYWLVASDGGIFAFGDAKFFGSTGGIRLNKPITAMAPTPTNKGYYLVSSDGGIFAFGDAGFYGSAGGTADNTYSKIVVAADNKGYWLIRNGGDNFGFGSVANTASATSPSRPPIALLYSTNTAGDIAVQWALGELGKPYIWGGNGPVGYDCSGLTSQAWKRAGVTIPRVANDQYNFGTRVALDQLRPGDLLFWGPDQSNDRSIDHVGMYIGGGWAINAGGTGTGVNIRNVPNTSGWMWPYGVRPKS